jgi:long-subunit fatty acid transport protein
VPQLSRRDVIGRISLLTLFALLLCSAPIGASTPDLFGYGARGQAMTGAVASTSRGHGSVYYNPARLAFDTAPSFSIGYSSGEFALRIDGEEIEVRSAPALTLGLSLPLPFLGWLEDRISLGLALVLPQTSVLIADIPRPTTPTFALLETRAQTVSIQAALAFRPLDWLSFGAGVIALAALEGHVKVGPNETGRLGSEVSDVLVADFAPVIGLSVEPWRWLSFAASYRGQSTATFTFPIEANLGDIAGQVGLSGLDVEVLPIPTLAIDGTAQFDPEQVGFEVAGRPVPWLLIAAGVSWKHWSLFENPIVYTAERPGDAPQPPPEFTDTVATRLGVEATLDIGPVTLEPRCGVAWEPTPSPPQTGYHNYLDNDRAVIGLGLGTRWQFLSLDVAFQFHHLVPRTAMKDETTHEDHPGWPSIQHAGEIFYMGAELGVSL